MCHYSSIFGSGEVFTVQLLTIGTIAATMFAWTLAYRRYGVPLKPYAIPIALWMVFGTLDILLTARGTFSDPMNEGNPLARFVFVNIGTLGPVVASALWISLWSLIVLVINRKNRTPNRGTRNTGHESNASAPPITRGLAGQPSVFVSWMRLEFPLVHFLSLAIFYSLAVGHIRGFGSWFIPLCWIGEIPYAILPGIGERFIAIVVVGMVLATLHMAIASIGIYDSKVR